MKEQIISFQTAKLAKECGFSGYCNGYYYKDTGKCEAFYCYYSNGINIVDYSNSLSCQAPTQELLQKWLREIHNIIVEPLFDETQNDTFVWLLNIYINQKNVIIEPHELFGNYFDNYEECLEEGLLESLKLLNKQQNEK